MPFAIGSHDRFVALLRPDAFLADLKDALRKYTTSTGYLLSVAQDDSHRHDLNGDAVEPVTDDNRERARYLVCRQLRKIQQSKQVGRASTPQPTKDRPMNRPGIAGGSNF